MNTDPSYSIGTAPEDYTSSRLYTRDRLPSTHASDLLSLLEGYLSSLGGLSQQHSFSPLVSRKQVSECCIHHIQPKAITINNQGKTRPTTPHPTLELFFPQMIICRLDLTPRPRLTVLSFGCPGPLRIALQEIPLNISISPFISWSATSRDKSSFESLLNQWITNSIMKSWCVFPLHWVLSVNPSPMASLSFQYPGFIVAADIGSTQNTPVHFSYTHCHNRMWKFWRPGFLLGVSPPTTIHRSRPSLLACMSIFSRHPHSNHVQQQYCEKQNQQNLSREQRTEKVKR